MSNLSTARLTLSVLSNATKTCFLTFLTSKTWRLAAQTSSSRSLWVPDRLPARNCLKASSMSRLLSSLACRLLSMVLGLVVSSIRGRSLRPTKATGLHPPVPLLLCREVLRADLALPPQERARRGEFLEMMTNTSRDRTETASQKFQTEEGLMHLYICRI